MTTDTAEQVAHTDEPCDHSAPDELREEAKQSAANIIARSRYEAWDEHAKIVTFGEYAEVDPQVHTLYLEDGMRDAEALMPLFDFVRGLGVMQGILAAADEVSHCHFESSDPDEPVTQEANDALAAVVVYLHAFAEALPLLHAATEGDEAEGGQ